MPTATSDTTTMTATTTQPVIVVILVASTLGSVTTMFITISLVGTCIVLCVKSKRRKRRTSKLSHMKALLHFILSCLTGQFVTEMNTNMAPNPIYGVEGSNGGIYETINECNLAKLSWSTSSQESTNQPNLLQLPTAQNGNHSHDVDDYIAMSSVRGSIDQSSTTSRYTTTPI